MNIDKGTSPTVYGISTDTVSQPVNVQPEPIAFVASGTSTAASVQYSKSAAAMVSETYVIATKK